MREALEKATKSVRKTKKNAKSKAKQATKNKKKAAKGKRERKVIESAIMGNDTPSTIVTEIFEPKHPANFYKGSTKRSDLKKGFVTPVKANVLKQVTPSKSKKKQETNPLRSIAESLGTVTPEQERSTVLSESLIQKGSFESGHKATKILRSVLIEGRVLFDIQWKRDPNRIQPLNTLISEEELKKQLRPRTYKKMLNKYLAEDSSPDK